MVLSQTLAVGARLGPFEITSLLGVGGMGEVYRATDTQLKRSVAIKVLPPLFADDADRLARFRREAEVLAALNHPHIAQIYGLETSNGKIALVIELVEGPTLAERIAQGPVPLNEALPIARQVADALDAAHQLGIVHRDLKPANIKLRPDGVVKVLDFGLAKALEAPGAVARVSMSPTITTPVMTQAGMLLGTAAYMSPEQAAGKAADKRSDLWALGVLLLEMLTGRPVFDGESVSHVIAAVLKDEPDWTTLPAATPVPIRRLLRRCLEKDRSRRLADAADARLEIDDALAAPGAESLVARSSKRAALGPIALALAGGGLVASLATWVATRPPVPGPAVPSRFTIVPRADRPLMVAAERDVTISPDGSHIVYRTAAGTGSQLMVRALNDLEARPLAGATGSSPFFSPDGLSVGFFSQTGSLQKVPMGGGPVVPIVASGLTGQGRGATWASDGSIVFATADLTSGLLRVPLEGGTPQVLTRPNTEKGERDHVNPSFLPDGHAVLFTITTVQDDNAQVAVLDLTTGQHKVLVRGAANAEYVEPGFLVYAIGDALHAVRFDAAQLQVLGDSVRVEDGVMSLRGGAAQFSVSRAGTLVVVPGTGTTSTVKPRSLVWVNRQGQEEPTSTPPRTYGTARLSPDGTRVALGIYDQDIDIWIWNLARNTLERLTKDAGVDMSPVWTHDGRFIIWAGTMRDGVPNLYRQAADGSGAPVRLTTSGFTQLPSTASPDDMRVLFGQFGGGQSQIGSGRVEIFSLDLTPQSSGMNRTELLLRIPDARTSNAEISLDGHWIAYDSNESGASEIYIRPFPLVNEGRVLVSTKGGSRPLWAKNGRELFYLDGAELLTAVPIQSVGSTMKPGIPLKVFDKAYFPGASIRGLALRGYDVSPDGQRFLMIKDDMAAAQASPQHLVVTINWIEEWRARLPAK